MPTPITVDFHCAQNFFIDKNLVDGAAEVQVSAIDLFFKAKPYISPLQFQNNPTLIGPGVSVFIVETSYSVPNFDVNDTVNYARVEYSSILTSSDATVPTKFRFDKPQTIKTHTEYSFIVKFDQNASFVLWKSKQGEYLTGTTTRNSGQTGTDIGLYYEFASGNLAPTTIKNNWKPLGDTELKFAVYCARYAFAGVPVTEASLSVNTELITPRPRGTFVDYVDGQFIIPSAKMEFITYNSDISSREIFVGGQMAYQNTVLYPGGKNAHTLSVTSNTIITAGATLPNGAAFSWSSIYPTVDNSWLVVFDTETVCVRQVASIISNTQIEVTEPVSFTNSAANFMITPVGYVSQFNKSSPFGISENIILLTNSTSNSTVRFVNNCIEFISPSGGGTGYSNSDIIYIKGFEYVTTEKEGGYVAVGYPTTNSTGGITSVSMANLGAGFTNASTISVVVANSSSGNTTANTSSGSGAVFSYNIGGTIRTDLRANNVFKGINVMNIAISDVIPFFEIDNPSGATFDLKLETRYTQAETANTISGLTYYLNEPNTNIIQLNLYQQAPVQGESAAVFMSRSNEFNTKYANGAPNDQVNSNYSNAIIMTINCASNNDYTSIAVNSIPVATFSKYLINNDDTDETTDRGNAWAKGITTKINFGRRAEDLMVYLTAYRPANTRVLVYARLYNSDDPEAFDDKDWTKLERTDSQTIFSSLTNPNDMIELAYKLRQHPAIDFTCNGIVSTTNASSVLTGVGTTFSNDLAVGDLIRVYPTLFPNTNILCVVNSIANDTSITINTQVTNNEFLGQTLNVDKLVYKHQTFNNIMNDNVCRYYNSSMIEFDGYDTLQIKTVLLSYRPNRIPRVDDIRVIGVSA
jgi:hypothetical protein